MHKTVGLGLQSHARQRKHPGKVAWRLVERKNRHWSEWRATRNSHSAPAKLARALVNSLRVATGVCNDAGGHNALFAK